MTDRPALRYFRCRHELLAVGPPWGYYKATGRSQIVFLPTSPGLQNGSPGLHTATGTHPDLCAVARHRPLVVYSSARHATPKPSSSGETRPHPAELVHELRRTSPSSVPLGTTLHAKHRRPQPISCRQADLFRELHEALPHDAICVDGIVTQTSPDDPILPRAHAL